jgi:hypothetical protein
VQQLEAALGIHPAQRVAGGPGLRDGQSKQSARLRSEDVAAPGVERRQTGPQQGCLGAGQAGAGGERLRHGRIPRQRTALARQPREGDQLFGCAPAGLDPAGLGNVGFGWEGGGGAAGALQERAGRVQSARKHPA